MAKIDDSVKKKVPELRFKGFTDDWEQRKFDECFNFPVSTNSLSRALLNYDEGDIKSVHYGDILIKYPAILNIKNDKIPYITGGKLEKYKSSLLENGDLIFADAAEDETVGKAVEVNGLTEENLVAGLHTIVARPKDKKAEFFLGYYINSNTYHRQLLRLIQGSKVSSISKGNLQKTLVSFPKDFEEQQKIGAFFKKIDDTIALHQHKLDLLKEQKKGFLQKMFPKNGVKVPELRFEGFADDWEERKFGELYKKNLERNKDHFSSDRTISIATMRFKKEGNGAAENSLVSYKVLREGDIAFEGHTSKRFAFGRFVLNDIGDGIMSPRFTTLRPTQNMPIKFWKQYIHYEPIMRYPIVNSTKLGTMMNELVVDEFLNQPVLVPELSEQEKIGSFFQQLDETIALHQRKLDLLKEQKKGFIKQMFV
ncbi:restriction endonuclease subunit S [Leuconostoc mesenteroides]|uniref:restriction endonuclease subunit S n=1 Tax=Leuconostoc mesenteroides TaxID=1245 RepID=UPI00235E7899|nr:restriction endonuclease subunit S [Leuconostoc mesenteroides]